MSELEDEFQSWPAAVSAAPITTSRSGGTETRPGKAAARWKNPLQVDGGTGTSIVETAKPTVT